MGAPKGSRNSRSWNDKRQKKVLKRIGDALASVDKAGIAFKNVSTLAKHIALIVGQSAGNLTRNSKYRVLLYNHLVKQKGAVSLIDDNHRGIDMLKAQIFALQLDNSNLRAEKERLDKYIQKHLAGIDPESPEDSGQLHVLTELNNHDDIAFENTAHLLLTIIERVPGLEINLEQGIIQDMGVGPKERDIATKEKSKWFVDYMRKRSAVST